MTGRARYHHGDLRKALVDAGLEILEAEGVGHLTLRGVAARAGVSHAAPAHHFPTLRALLTALAAIAFERFDRAMTEARAGAPPDPASQITAASAGYLRFALDNPGLFRLMFSADRLDWTDPTLCEAAEASRAQLRAIAAPICDLSGLTDPAARLQVEHLVWAAAHGQAHLALEGKLDPQPGGLPIGRVLLDGVRPPPG